MHLFLRQLVTGSIGEDGACDWHAPIPIGLSELDVSSACMALVLGPLHNEFIVPPNEIRSGTSGPRLQLY